MLESLAKLSNILDLSNLVHDFWEEFFRKPKLLLTDIKISRSPAPLRAIVFLHRIATSGVTTSWYLFHEVKNAASLYCETIFR